ncbi:MFS transporter [Thalassovita taeanensis]|uniref:Predicted arabinose efflux permease, MFS family n=1 Tax=Thalassovita taeanensis TaxID=657014 RepID=A0A1H8YSU9_9RHOB|nr:MFS transporter [Thalassovita taeanensis]SEP55304.1 Predicted arabinose efflux permease, MFS family [Thalassovita taeanensis]
MPLLTRPVPLLTATIGVVGANSLVLPPIATIVAVDLGGDPGDILRAAAAYGAGTALSALLLAPRADLIGADKALRQAAFVLVLALVLSWIAPTAMLLIVAQALAGLGAGMALPAIYSLAAQVGPKGREKQTIGTVLTGWTISLVGGVALSAFLADLAGWRAVYALLGAMTLMIWVLLGRCDMQVTRIATTATSPLTGLRVPGITRGLLSNAMLMLGFYGAYSFMGAHVVERIGLTTSAAGVVTLFYGSGFGIAAFLDKYLDRLPARRATVVGFAGLTVVYVTMGLAAASYATLLAVAFCWGIFQHFALNTVVGRLTALEPTQRGAIMGLNSAVTYLCVMGGSLFFRLPYEAGGLRACVAYSALFAIIATIESLWPEKIRTFPSAG